MNLAELEAHERCDYCKKPVRGRGVPGFAAIEVKSYILQPGDDDEPARLVQTDNTTACWYCWTELIPQPGHRKGDGNAQQG